MSDFYADMVSHIKGFVKSCPKGAEMPDEVCESIIWNFLYESVKERWFITDNFARWFEGEFNFSQEEIAGIIAQISGMATEVGFEVIFPGQPLPEELQTPQQDAQATGEFYDEAVAVTETGEEAPMTEPTETEAPPPSDMMEIGQTPTMEEAEKILGAIVNGTIAVDQVVSQAILEKVLPSSYTLSIFSAESPATGFEVPVVRSALCLHALIEIDYLHYSGAKKVAGFSISAAVKNSQELLNKVTETKQIIGEIRSRFTGVEQVDMGEELDALIKRMDETAVELNNIVTTFSEMPEEEVAPPPTPEEEKVPPKAAKAVHKKEKEKVKTADIAKIAGAFILMMAIIVVVSLYLHKILVAPPERIFDPSKYASIIPLKEARQSQTSFLAVVPSSEWNKLSKDDKLDRAQRLLVAAKDDQISTIVLTDETGKLLVQTYGGEARVIH